MTSERTRSLMLSKYYCTERSLEVKAELIRLETEGTELKTELDALLREQFGLRMQLATQSLTKNSEIQRVKREIAQVHTVLTEKAKASKQ